MPRAITYQDVVEAAREVGAALPENAATRVYRKLLKRAGFTFTSNNEVMQAREVRTMALPLQQAFLFSPEEFADESYIGERGAEIYCRLHERFRGN